MIKISYNPDEEMMSISTDNETVFYGNYWDFSRNPEAIGNFLYRLGLDVHVDKDLPAVG